MSRRVVKFGGSSLSIGSHAERLRAWLKTQSPAETILVVGGGPAVRAIAADQQRDEFSDAQAHWMCIDVMRRNSIQLLKEIPGVRLLEDVDALPAADASQLWILDPLRFMEDDSYSRAPLPESWDVSSDSIAARAAERFAAEELVLLKSRLPRGLQRLGHYVDPCFTAVARNITSVRFVNLRDANFAEVRWR